MGRGKEEETGREAEEDRRVGQEGGNEEEEGRREDQVGGGKAEEMGGIYAVEIRYSSFPL